MTEISAKIIKNEINVTISAGGGGGAVSSVNEQTGDVVLDTGDIAEVADKNYVSDAEKVVLSNTSNTNTGDETTETIKSKLGIDTLSGDNTGDQDLSGLVEKVEGKGLSTNDYTTEEQSKLAGIEAGAEVNVNADWNAESGDAQILNKPTSFTPTAHQHTQAESHNSADTDSATTAIHHTLGTGANQAAAGNHAHTDNDSNAFALQYVYSRTVDANPPASGGIKFNNSTPTSVTNIKFSEVDSNGLTVDAILDTVSKDDFVMLTVRNDPAKYQIFKLTSNFVSGAGVDTMPVVWVTGYTSQLADNAAVSVSFMRRVDAQEGLKIGLMPGSFNLIGATAEPLYVGVDGTNRDWSELQFTDSATDLLAGFSIPSALTTKYKAGTIYIKIDFYHTQATTTTSPSFRFACGLKSLAIGTAPDTAPPTSSTGYATGDYEVPDNADTSELRSITITLSTPSLTAGDNWIGYIKRLSNGVDYATGIAKVVGVTIYE